MEKVYILTIDDTNERWGNTFEILVFSSLARAKEYLEKRKIEFLLTMSDFDEDDIVEEGEMSYTWYLDGYYDRNHYSLHIEEKEIL